MTKKINREGTRTMVITSIFIDRKTEPKGKQEFERLSFGEDSLFKRILSKCNSDGEFTCKFKFKDHSTLLEGKIEEVKYTPRHYWSGKIDKEFSGPSVYIKFNKYELMGKPESIEEQTIQEYSKI